MTITPTSPVTVRAYWHRMFVIGLRIEARGNAWSTWVIDGDDETEPQPRRRGPPKEH